MAAITSQHPEELLRDGATDVAAGTWDEILGPVRPFLQKVSQRLEEQVDEFEPEIAEHARYALDSQGKQLRPALVALAAGAVGELKDDHITVAVLVEMVHLATLVHDDIMDEALMRRGRPTVGARWGNHLAVLLGDCLFAHAMKISAALPSPEVFRSLAAATSAVCTGEILQSNRRRRWDLPRTEYLRMVEMKTAELFAVAAELGARQAGGTPEQQATLREYALAVGTAYQVYDDCIDLFGSEQIAGKSLGTDLQTGKLTLPLIVFLERASPVDRNEMLGWLARWDPAYFVGLRVLLEQHGGLAESSAVIEDLLQRGRDALKPLAPTPERQGLIAFTRFIGRQTSLLGT